ncbi:hypothetical protein Enr17x_21800 [Gimesia fumaroli]|uniref:Uncharacterized protein n=2 Tax=Gimesia fumaroli TaxID=2527976 RepID=A0A518IAR9_9PLAN|nr:hypothetical protein Enr17x_21800 [Gimesia fumaroli]
MRHQLHVSSKTHLTASLLGLASKNHCKRIEEMKVRLLDKKWYFSLGFLLLSCCCFITGCGQAPPQKEIRVETPIGKPGVCDNCKQKIDDVTAENLMTYNAIQHVVCNKKCANELKQKLASQ